MKATARQPSPMASARQLRMIWALSHRRGFDESALREWIRVASGQSSFRHLTAGQASQIIDGLQSGVKDADAFRAQLAERSDRMTVAQARLIDQLAGSLGWESRRMAGLVRHMYGRSPRESLTRRQASGLIEALKAMAQRRAA